MKNATAKIVTKTRIVVFMVGTPREGYWKGCALYDFKFVSGDVEYLYNGLMYFFIALSNKDFLQ